jgi:hypothetical protein
MRRIGAEAATRPIVAIIEEHCVAGPRWIEAIESSFRPGDAAVGGPIVDDQFARLRDWVVYWSEYHNFMPPWSDGPRAALNGANIAYDRTMLLKRVDVLDSGYWEVVLHPVLSKAGTFRAVSAMGVRHTGPFDLAYYLRQRYLLSRVWGGTQKDHVSGATRLAHVVLAPVLPVVMTARIAARVLNQGERVGTFVRALPLVGLAMGVLTLGETLGYIAGSGRALEEVE